MTMIKDDQTLPAPSPDTAVIVFMFNSSDDVIYDVTSENPELVGMTRYEENLAYEVSAGKHYFMTLFGNRLLAANLSGGKTYYVLMEIPTPEAIAGIVSTLFINSFTVVGSGQFVPVRNGGEGRFQYLDDYLQKTLEEGKFAELTPKAREYFSKEMWVKNVKKSRKKNLPKFKDKSAEKRLLFTLNPEDGVSRYHSNQNTPITQGVKKEPNIARPFLDKEKELSVSAAENSEPESRVSPAYIKELEALVSLRDDGIISGDEFQKQKTEILTSTQRIQTPVQPKAQFEEVDHAEIGYKVGDQPSKNLISSTTGDARSQQSHDSKKPLNEEFPTKDKGTSKQTAGNQNDSSEVKKTEWVREVGGRKLYCVRTADQTICQ